MLKTHTHTHTQKKKKKKQINKQVTLPEHMQSIPKWVLNDYCAAVNANNKEN